MQQTVVLKLARGLPIAGAPNLADRRLDGIGEDQTGLARFDLGRLGIAERKVVEGPVEGHHGELERLAAVVDGEIVDDERGRLLGHAPGVEARGQVLGLLEGDVGLVETAGVVQDLAALQ